MAKASPFCKPREMRVLFFLFLLFPLSLSAQVKITLTDGELPFSDLLIEVVQCGRTDWKRTDANGVLQIAPTSVCDSLRLHFEDITYGHLDSVFLLSKSSDSIILTLSTIQQAIEEVRISGFRSSVKSSARGRSYLIDSSHFQPNTKVISALQRLPGIVPQGFGSLSLFGAQSAPVYYVDDIAASTTFVENLDIHDIERVEVRNVSLSVEGDGGEIYIYRKKRNFSILRGEVGSAADYTWGNDRLGWLGYGNLYYQNRASDLFLSLGRDAMKELQNEYKRFSSHNYNTERRETVKQEDIKNTAALRWNYLLNKYTTIQMDGNCMLRNIERETELQPLHEKQNRKFQTDDLELRATIKTKLSDEINLYTSGYYNAYNSSLHYKSPAIYHHLKQSTQTALGEFRSEFGAYSLGASKHTLTALYRFSYDFNTSEKRYYSSSYISRFGLSDFIELNSVFSLYLGCRYDSDLNLFAHQNRNRKHYFFPTVTLSYNSSWGNTSLKFKRNVMRPDITRLDSSTRWWASERQVRGNPDLLPVTANQYTLRQSKTFGNHSLDLSVNYISSRNITSSIYMPNNKTSYYTNVAAADFTSLIIYYSANLFDYSLYVGIFGSLLYSNYWLYPHYRTTSRLIAKDTWSVDFAPSIQYTHLNFSTEIYFSYGSAHTSISNQDTEPLRITVMLKYGFYNDRLQLRLSSLNLVAPWSSKQEELQLTDYSFSQETTKPFALRLSLSYQFGKYFKSRNEKTITPDDYLEHLE